LRKADYPDQDDLIAFDKIIYNLYFKKSILYEGKNEIKICISFIESCTCNKLSEYKKYLEAKKLTKEIEDLKQLTEEMKKKNEEKEKQLEEEKKKNEEMQKKLEKEKKKEDEEKNKEIQRLKEFNFSIKKQLDLLYMKIKQDKQNEKKKN